MRWDPVQYAHYAGERGRPFVDLVARIGAQAPRHVADVGCGPGVLTAELARRWPEALVDGVDSSPEMIAEAAPLATDRLRFTTRDARDWTLPEDLDVLISNATLQWVPGHLDLLEQWARRLSARPDGWLAIQVPANFDAPSHRLMRELAADARWVDTLEGVLRHDDAVAEPGVYAEVLHGAGLVADVWETTYLHALDGVDPVLEWVRGTGLRPVLAALDPPRREIFEREYAAALREAYPAGPDGTVFAFRRIFAVGASSMITGYDHVQIAIPEGGEATARAFYGALLGMTELPKPPVLAARGGCWFSSGSAVLHLGVERPFAPARKAHPAFVVDDLDSLAATLRTRGFDVQSSDGELPGIRRVHAHDPFGNRLEFQQA